MEGPSLFLAAEQLAPFIHQTIDEVSGNTKIGKERLLKQKVLDIFSWGKHLVFQFEGFALRVHFMLFGSFEATVDGRKVTGDYPRRHRIPRLVLTFKNGDIEMYSCSLQYKELADAKKHYDYTIDILSVMWDSKNALERIQNFPDSQIGDLLLDQTLFAGVGNIIKNEVLFLVRTSPERMIRELSLAKLKKIIKTIREFVFQFYAWRKNFELKKHYRIYRKTACTRCGAKVIKKKTGLGARMSYICPTCQI